MTVIVIFVIVVALVAFIHTRPASFRLERSTVIAAPAEKIFPLIADFHEWTKWSPFEAMDTDLKRTYAGAPSGVGAIYTWDGKKSGAGRMEILEAPAPSRVKIKLDFTRPFPAHNIAEFDIKPEGTGNRVAWTMSGPQPFIAKAMGIFMSSEKFVGPMFEKGLADMKRVAESA